MCVCVCSFFAGKKPAASPGKADAINVSNFAYRSRMVSAGAVICCSPPTPSSLPYMPACLPASSAIAHRTSHHPPGLGVLSLHEGHQSPPSAPPPPEGEAAPVAHQQDLRHARILPSLAREARRRLDDYQRDQGAAGGWLGCVGVGERDAPPMAPVTIVSFAFVAFSRVVELES